MTRLLSVLGLLALAALLAHPAPAQAASPTAILLDCAQDGKLDRQYSGEDLRRAKGELTGDLDEYYDCREVLDAAINKPPRRGSDSGGGGQGAGSRGGEASGPDGGAPAPPDPAAAAEDARELEVATERVAKGSPNAAANASFEPGGEPDKLPMPTLILLAACAMAGLGLGAWRSLR